MNATSTVCGPGPKLPVNVTCCGLPAECAAVTAWTPPSCLPSNVSVQAASPFQASSDSKRVMLSDGVGTAGIVMGAVPLLNRSAFAPATAVPLNVTPSTCRLRSNPTPP